MARISLQDGGGKIKKSAQDGERGKRLMQEAVTTPMAILTIKKRAHYSKGVS